MGPGSPRAAEPAHPWKLLTPKTAHLCNSSVLLISVTKATISVRKLHCTLSSCCLEIHSISDQPKNLCKVLCGELFGTKAHRSVILFLEYFNRKLSTPLVMFDPSCCCVNQVAISSHLPFLMEYLQKLHDGFNLNSGCMHLIIISKLPAL